MKPFKSIIIFLFQPNTLQMLSMFPTEQSKNLNKHRKLISELVLKNYSEFLEAYKKDLYENGNTDNATDTIHNLEYLKHIQNERVLFEMVYLSFKCGFRAGEEYYKNVELTYKKHLQDLLEETKSKFNSHFEDEIDQIEAMNLLMNTPNIVEIMKLMK